MSTFLSFKRQGMSTGMNLKSSFTVLLNSLRRTIFSSFLLSLICLTGFSVNPTLADASTAVGIPEIASQSLANAAEGERISSLINCLPKQLSQPSFKRAWSEMGNDQLERALNLKINPKLSQAELELKQCLNQKSLAS